MFPACHLPRHRDGRFTQGIENAPFALAPEFAPDPGVSHAAQERKGGASVGALEGVSATRALGRIPAEGIKGDQQDRKHDDPQVPCARSLFPPDQVGDCGAEKKYLQSGAQTRRDFDEGKLIDEGNKEDRAARQGGY